MGPVPTILDTRPIICYPFIGLTISCAPVCYFSEVLFGKKKTNLSYNQIDQKQKAFEKITAKILFIPSILWTITLVVTVPIGFVCGIIHEIVLVFRNKKKN